ncbi:MAG: ferric reductase-like transmembrane domain-containing protein [Brooklawnia sp.]|jgi:predicted ferric reductase
MWAGQDSIHEKRLTTAKSVLVAVIAVTTVLPLFFVTPDDGPLHINIFKYLAKTGAFVGSMLMIWQFLLGFRGAVSTILPDLSWVANLHRALGQFGVPIILLHPIFIGLYYAQARGTNIFALDLSERFSLLVLLGMVTLAIVAFIVVTSAFLRGRLGFYRWLYTHLSSYLVPPFLFIHSFLLGPTIQGTGLFYYWWFFTFVVIVLCGYRLAHKLGASAAWYRVTRARKVAHQTTEILMAPETQRLRPAAGQFVYLRGSVAGNAHPYTVSAFDADSGTLGVTVSQDGPQSTRLQDSQEGDRLLLDGPFGVFSRPAMATDLPLVMVAGGVGITAFRRLWQRLEADRGREAHLFYGNETYPEIAYRDELDALTHVHVVHVLNQEPDHAGETGFVTADVLRRNLPRELDEYQFLLCGPPPMVISLEEELTEAGVSGDQVRHELFAS